MRARPPTPPTTPPAMAPVFVSEELVSELGSVGAEGEGVDEAGGLVVGIKAELEAEEEEALLSSCSCWIQVSML